jgi:hypothetical protein
MTGGCREPGAATGAEMRVVDLLSYSSSHLAINGFWIEQLRSRGRFHIVAEARHLDALTPGASRGPWSRPVRKGSGWKLWRELRFLAAILSYLDRPVFVMGATGLQVLWLALLERMLPRSARRWLVVLHSEVEGVESTPGMMKAAAGVAIRRLRFPRRARCVVLGKHIKENLRSLGVDVDRIHVVEHPLPAIAPRTMRHPRSSVLRIAVVGLLRGDTKDLSIAAAVARQPGVSVSMIGRAGPGYQPQPGVRQQVLPTHYTTTWMEEALREEDVLLLSPSPRGYRFTALGSIGDAITYGKCAAWLRHDALASYEGAPFAVCAGSSEELVRRIGEFEVPSQARVEQWVQGWNAEASQRINVLWDRIVAPEPAS